jgi:dTDP-4-amino-4,6-dideoxygalactose transaminase
VANEYDLFVLEDAAQSFGAIYKDRRAGAFGHIGATSFFPAKPLGCYGDGGALFTDDGELAEKIRSIRVHGKGKHKYDNIRIGTNGRLDTIQAAILLSKLDIFADEFSARQRIAQIYSNQLEDLVQVPYVPEESTSAWAQYSILTVRREELRAYLLDQGIPTAIYYPTPLHTQTAFSYIGYTKGDFPTAEEVSRRILSLPMHPYLLDSEVEKIAMEVGQFLRTSNGGKEESVAAIS